MKTGISTGCLFPELTEHAFQILLDLGERDFEIFLNSRSEASASFAKKISSMAKDKGASVLSVHSYTSEYEGVSFFGSYPRRFEDGLEELKYIFEFCQIVGAPILVFHGSRDFFCVEDALYIERFARLMEEAKRFGVLLAQENVHRFKCGSLEFLRELTRALPDAVLVLDLKQAIRSGYDPFDVVRAVGKNIRHLHMSDTRGRGECLLPGDGDFDFQGFSNLLKQTGYSGSCVLEVYRNCYSDYADLIKHLFTLRKNLI